MVNEKQAQTAATVAAAIAVVSTVATRLQSPDAIGRSAAMDHKVASVMMKRLNKHLQKKGE